jgi:hypothetical protein
VIDSIGFQFKSDQTEVAPHYVAFERPLVYRNMIVPLDTSFETISMTAAGNYRATKKLCAIILMQRSTANMFFS